MKLFLCFSFTNECARIEKNEFSGESKRTKMERNDSFLKIIFFYYANRLDDIHENGEWNRTSFDEKRLTFSVHFGCFILKNKFH